MAAAVGGGDSGGGGKKGRKSHGTPHIDMTPMVDLGFLLLTFFVLTTSMSTPSTMPVIFPADPPPGVEQPPPPEIAQSKILNVLVSGNDKLYWYKGIEDVELNSTSYGEKGLRKLVLDQKKLVQAKFPNDEKPLIIIVKSNQDARYQNMVDIIDEMNITEQGKYVLVDMEPEEVALISDYEKQMNLESSQEKTLEVVDISKVE